MYDIKPEFENLVRAYQLPMYRLIYTYCSNHADAEDAVQTAFLKLLETDKSFESELHVKNWLYQVAVNYARDILRSRWRNYTPLPPELTAQEPEERRLYEALLQLQPKYRIVVLLYYYEGYSVREIAGITSVRETAVQTRLYRARKQLKKILKEEWSDE